MRKGFEVAGRVSNSLKAAVIGAGPNGLSAAIALAQAGCSVEVFEAQAQAGGAVRTLELTLPGFCHDFGAAVFPMAAGSPFFSTLPLERFGLNWIHSPATLAHPFDDGTAITLERNFREMESVLGKDGSRWRRLFEPLSRKWESLSQEILKPVLHLPKHLFLLASFGWRAMLPASVLAKLEFRDVRTQALFAGLAAHSFLDLNDVMSGSFALVLGATAHAVGWPIAQRGSQSITNALCSYLETLGGKVITSNPIETLDSLQGYDLTLCDVTPRQLLRIASRQFSEGYKRELKNYRYGPGVFKVDYALSEPIPWKAKECFRSATVHLGGSLEECVSSEYAMSHGKHAEKPVVLLAQPTLFDSSRAPKDKHTAWAYCHTPHGSEFDMLPRLEAQIERFAPGFRDCILARRVFFPAALEIMDANLVGGDIGGGSVSVKQFLMRPTMRYYRTSAENIYICSSSTPPGGGVHGMCGYHAAQSALKSTGRQ